MPKEVPLTRGKVAIVDDEDADRVGRLSWHASPKRNGRWYAQARACNGGPMFALGRFILDARPGQVVHYRNGDALDCRRRNLLKGSAREVAYWIGEARREVALDVEFGLRPLSAENKI